MMSTIFHKDADETLDYQIDWSKSTQLGEDTIASAEWLGLTGDLSEVTTAIGDQSATVWISGGTPGASYGIVCRATTNAGRILEEEFTLAISAQQDTGELDAETETATAATSATDIIEAIDAHLLGQLQAGGARDYMIQDKRITRYELSELIQLRETYVALARQQALGVTAGTKRTYWTRARPKV